MSLLGGVFAGELWAAASAGAEAHEPSLLGVIFPLINFLILLYLAQRFVLPLVRDHLRLRREQIRSAVVEAREEWERAEQIVREYRDRMARLGEESKKILAGLNAEAERDRTRLLAEAEELARKIKADAGFVGEQEVKVARRRLREEMAEIAQATAQGLLKSRITPEDQRRLMEDFLRGVAS